MTVPNVNTSKSLRANTDPVVQKEDPSAAQQAFDEEANKPDIAAPAPELTQQQRVAQKIALERASDAKVVVHPGCKFYWGKFAPRSSMTDPESVRLSVEGEPLSCQRGKRILLPEPFKVAADNTSMALYSRDPAKDGKPGGMMVEGYVTRYKFDVEGEPITGPEAYRIFREMFMTGSKKTKEAVQRFGIANVPKDEAVPQMT
jgi:hypothetical protein